MTKQPKRIKAKEKSLKFNGIKDFVAHHKKLTFLVIIILLISMMVGVLKYNHYLNKFSDKDYSAIEGAAKTVFRSIGATDINQYKYCHYVAPEVYSNIELFCGIKVNAYLTYENDQHAINTAKSLEREIKKLGATISHMSDFYADPSNMLTGISVTFNSPLPKKQCHFTIASHDKAKKLSSPQPPRVEDNLIGLAFECSAESREEYFPVTYRQGS